MNILVSIEHPTKISNNANNFFSPYMNQVLHCIRQTMHEQNQYNKFNPPQCLNMKKSGKHAYRICICPEVLWRCECQFSAITLLISALLHEAKTRQPGITSCQMPNTWSGKQITTCSGKQPTTLMQHNSRNEQ